MLYRFKSRAAADVVMLQPNAEELLKIISKEPGEKGIITAAQAPAAIAALRAEISRREALPTEADTEDEDADYGKKDDPVGLRQRALPLIELLERSSAAGKDVVWGV